MSFMYYRILRYCVDKVSVSLLVTLSKVPGTALRTSYNRKVCISLYVAATSSMYAFPKFPSYSSSPHHLYIKQPLFLADDPQPQQTDASNGRLSLRELRSANEARRFYSDERARARAEDTTTSDQEHKIAAGAGAGAGAGVGARASDEEKGPANTGSSSRSTSTSRGSRRSKRHRQERGDGGGPNSSSGERRGVRAMVAVAAAATGLASPHRIRTPEGDLLRKTRGDMGPSLLAAADDRAAAVVAESDSPVFSLPLMGRSRSPSVKRSDGGGWNDRRGGYSLEKAANNDNDSSAASAAGASAAGGAGREAGAVEAVADEGVMLPAEAGSLSELRDALRSREKELVRLKRDVAIVATNAGDFKHLAASLGSSADMNNNERRSFSSDHRRRRRPSYGEDVGGGTEDGDRPGSKSSSSGRSDLGSISGFEGHGPGGAGGRPSVSRQNDGTGGLLSLRRRPYESGPASSNRTTAPLPRTDSGLTSPRQTMPPPPPRIVVQQQQTLTSANSGGTTAALALSGSPLVASTHEGLRQMRAVLEQQVLETERTKGDAKNVVRFGK